LGGTNKFIFNFGSNSTGRFLIYVRGGMSLGKFSAEFQGTAVTTPTEAARRIRFEAQGTGTALTIENGSSQATQSRWLGTLYAPNGGILIGSGTGNTEFFGAFWSGRGANNVATNSATTVEIRSGVNGTFVAFEPFAPVVCTASVAINPGEGVNQLSTPVTGKLELSCNDADQQYTLTAVPSNLTGTLTYTWETADGNFLTNPPPNSASAIITMQGTYKVTVSNGTCSTSTQVIVNSCVVQAGDVQKQGGKVVDPVLTQFYKSLTDPSILNPFFVPNGQDPLICIRTGPVTGVREIMIDAVTNSLPTSPANGLAFLKGPSGNDFTEIRSFNNTLTGFTINGWIRADRLIDVDQNGTPFFNTVYPTYAPYSAGFTEKDQNVADDIIVTGGDKAMAADIARAAYGIDGTGLTIGIISDSYNKLSNNDVPLELPSVNPDGSAIIVRDFPTQRSDEGRAMAQIVYDIAPGANLKFHTGFVSEVDMANAIVDLADLGCNIIVDDVTYITAPYFGKGSIARAVEKVTTGTKNGQPYNVKYFTSAGNFANKGYESAFTGTRTFGPSGSMARIHQFRAATTTDPGIYQQIQLTDPNPGSYVLVLQWDDKFYSTGDGGTTNDLDIYLTDITSKPILGYNRSHSSSTQSDPFEVLPFSVGGPTTVNVMVIHAGGTNPNPNIKFKFIIYRGKGVQYVNRAAEVNASTIMAHAASPYAMSVAAAAYRPYSADLIKLPADNPAQFVTDNLLIKVEPFSSIGFLNTDASLNKPDFTGPDGVNTSVNLGTSGDIENDNNVPNKKSRFNFYGTSAAAPHAAALSALVIQAKKKFRNQDMTYLDVKSLLQSTATNIQDAAAFDVASGAGLINGMKAIATFAKPKPTITGGLVFTPIGENQLNIDPRAPSVPQPVTINGYNFTVPVPASGNTPEVTGSQVWIGGVQIPAEDVTVVSTTQITFTLKQWNPLDPAVNVVTPPTIIDQDDANNDGGKSNDVTFLGVVKENVRVEAVVNYLPRNIEPTTFVYYGETIPQFGYKIFVNNTEILNPVLADYGLTGLTLVSSVLPQGYVPGRYNVAPKLPINPSDKLQLYNYTTENTSLRVRQVPVKITPVSGKVITYGQPFPEFDYDYVLPADIYPEDASRIRSLLTSEYEQYISKDLAIINGAKFVNGKIVIESFDKTGSLLSRIIALGADEGVAEVNNGDEGVAEVNNFINLSNAAFSNIAFMATQAASEDGVAEVNGIDEGVAEVNTVEGVAEANAFILDFRTLNTVLENIDGVAEVNTVEGVAEANNGEDGVAEVNSAGDEGVAEVNSGIYSANGILISESAPLVNNLTVANAVPLFNGMVVINNFSDDGVAEANGLSAEDGVAEVNNNDEGVAEVNNASELVNGILVNVGIIDNDGVAEANANDGVAEVNAQEGVDGVAEVNQIDGVAEANGTETSGVSTGVRVAYYSDGRILIFQNSGGVGFEDGVAEANAEEGADGVAEVNNVPINNADLKVADAPELMVILHRTDVAASFITGNYSSVNAVTGITPGKKHVIIPGGFFTKNWDVTYGLGTFEVHKLGTVINADDVTATYNGQPHPVLATIKAVTGTQTITGATYTVTYTNRNGTPAYNSTTPPTTAGVYNAKIEYGGNENYKAATKTVILSIAKIDPTVTTSVVSGPTFTYDGTARTATGTVTGLGGVTLEPALTFTYTGTLANGTTYSGGAPTNAGTYSVTGNFAGNDNYNALSSVPYAFTINKATPTVNVSSATVTYNGTPRSLTGTTTGIPADGNLSPALTFTYNGVADQPINAGAYTVEASFAGNDNYTSATGNATLTINKANPTINVATLQTFTFAPNTPRNMTGSVTGVVDNETILTPALSFTYDGSATAPTNVGTYTVVASFAGNINFNPAELTGLSLVINNAPAVTVGVTVASKTYDGNPAVASTPTFTVNGVSAGTPTTITYNYTGTGTTNYSSSTAPTNAGSYNLVVSYSGLANYTDGSSPAVPFTISKAVPTITVATPQTFVFDGNPKSIVGTVTGVNLTGGLTFTYNGSSIAPTAAGNYNVVASYAGDANYEARTTTGTTLTLSITNAPAALVTVSVPQPYVYNAVAPIPTITITVNGSPVSPTTVTRTYTGTGSTAYGPTTTAPVNAGTYSLVVNYSGLTNYANGSGSANFTISRSSLTLRANDLITNNGATPQFTSTLTATPTVTGATITYSLINSTGPVTTPLSSLSAGTYTIIPAISGGNSANYNQEIIGGTLYVNPFGNNVRSIKPTLECVTDNGDGTFFANYAYTNTNTVDVWIPAGSPDNYILESNPGAVLNGGLPPTIFKAGGGRFRIRFDGSKNITWIVQSFEKRQKTSSASSASSSSNKCGNNFSPASVRLQNGLTGESIKVADKVYPNPFIGRVMIESDFTDVTVNDIKIIDLIGREFRPLSSRKLSATRMEIDLSNLVTGQCYIRVNSKAGVKVFKVMRQ
jgi:hypothetical protein